MLKNGYESKRIGKISFWIFLRFNYYPFDYSFRGLAAFKDGWVCF